METGSIIAIIVAGASALATLHINRIKLFGGCIESDCKPDRRGSAPLNPQPLATQEEEVFEEVLHFSPKNGVLKGRPPLLISLDEIAKIEVINI